MGREVEPLISATAFERRGTWRWIVGVFVFSALVAPAAPMILGVFGKVPDGGLTAWVGSGFLASLGASLGTAVSVAGLSALLGMPLGLLAGVYAFPGRAIFLGLSALPLLVPSFLWAIGLSNLRLPVPASLATVAAFSSLGVSLVLFATLGALRGTTRSQADALRVAGGERFLMAALSRRVLSTVIPAALLAGVLSLSDPGPGQILGSRGVASEILISFSALYDFELATRQCLALGAVTLLLAIPISLILGRHLTGALLGKDTARLIPRRTADSRWAGPIAFTWVLGGLLVLPLVGWLEPLFRDFPVARVLSEGYRTIGDTLIYAGLAGATSLILGGGLSLAVGRNSRAAALVFSALLLLLCLPPSLSALGVVYSASHTSESLDFLFRSRLTVGVVQGLRWVVVGFLLMSRGVSSTSPSWTSAAALHGIGLGRYGFRVLLPWLKGAMLASFVLAALLATSEVGSVVLLRPPGADSFPVAVFTIMANAPESLVAASCLLYVAFAALALVGGGVWLSRRPA